MSVVHDAFLFQPTSFRDVVLQLTEPEDRWGLPYGTLRDAALAAFRATECVRLLADRYGGWDEQALLRELPVEHSEDASDFAPWLMLLLYQCLAAYPSAEDIGFGPEWAQAESALRHLGFAGHNWQPLVDGHALVSLFSSHLPAQLPPVPAPNDLCVITTALRPPSTASSVGWLSHADVRAYCEHLRLARVERDDQRGGVLWRSMRMLSVAAQQGCGLCMIKSG